MVCRYCSGSGLCWMGGEDQSATSDSSSNNWGAPILAHLIRSGDGSTGFQSEWCALRRLVDRPKALWPLRQIESAAWDDHEYGPSFRPLIRRIAVGAVQPQ